MNNAHLRAALIGLATALAATALSSCSPQPAAEHVADPAEPARGPHRGVVLSDGAFTIELAVYETHVPPEYRAWPTHGGHPVPLDDVQLTVEVSRLGGEVNRFAFRPEGDYLRGDGVLEEPHSFSVAVTASHAGVSHRWNYDSFEGRTSIAADIAEQAGIRTEIAGPATLTESLSLYGRIVVHPEYQRDLTARFPGLVRSVSKQLGDSVAAGDSLAVIESNDSLQTYVLRSPIAGTLSYRDADPGEESGTRVLFSVTDRRALLAELSVFPKDRTRIRVGDAVALKDVAGDATASGTVIRMHSQVQSNQAVQVWVQIDGQDGNLLPGSLVAAQVAVAQHQVPLAVKTSGLQAFRDFTVVYAQLGDTYEVRMLDLGATHGEWVEVLGGLDPGTRYVTENSYLIKADIEKSGAAHDH